MRISRNQNPIIHTAKEFYEAYQAAPNWLRNSLCEFYLHGFLIPFETEWNPLPYIGDIHLREFMSWATNEVNYGRQWETYEEAEKIEPVPLRSQSSNPHVMLKDWFDLTYGINNVSAREKIFDIRKQVYDEF